MNKFIVAAAIVASFGYAATAEAHRDDPERDAWFQTMQSVPAPSVMERNVERDMRQPVIEGRNAATAAPSEHVEPYIAREEEANGRSTH